MVELARVLTPIFALTIFTLYVCVVCGCVCTGSLIVCLVKKKVRKESSKKKYKTGEESL